MLEILQPASFMMEVGRIVIANELVDQKKDAAFKEALKTIQTPLQLSELEKAHVGFTNEEITAKIFEQWNLESELVESIHFSSDVNAASDHIKPFARALNIVKHTVHLFGQFDDLSVARALTLLDTYGLSPDPYLQTVEQFKQ